MMNTYKDQITNLCIQTYYNLYGVMPDAQELAGLVYRLPARQGDALGMPRHDYSQRSRICV